jgi:hypothetical protein
MSYLNGSLQYRNTEIQSDLTNVRGFNNKTLTCDCYRTVKTNELNADWCKPCLLGSFELTEEVDLLSGRDKYTNFDPNFAHYDEDILVQKRYTKSDLPKGISVRNFRCEHEGYEVVNDIPPLSAWKKDAKFRIMNFNGNLVLITDGSTNRINAPTDEYNQLIDNLVENKTYTSTTKARKIQKQTLLSYICYELKESTILPKGLFFTIDNDLGGHCTIYPTDGENSSTTANIYDNSEMASCTIYSKDECYYAFCEDLYDLDWTPHCVLLKAAVEPPMLESNFDLNGWKIAGNICKFSRTFGLNESLCIDDLLEIMEVKNYFIVDVVDDFVMKKNNNYRTRIIIDYIVFLLRKICCFMNSVHEVELLIDFIDKIEDAINEKETANLK